MIILIYPGSMITLDIDDFYANLFFNGIIMTWRPYHTSTCVLYIVVYASHIEEEPVITKITLKIGTG